MFNGDIIVLNIFIRKLEQLKTNELGVQANKIEKKQLSKAGGGKKRKKILKIEADSIKQRMTINKLMDE